MTSLDLCDSFRITCMRVSGCSCLWRPGEGVESPGAQVTEVVSFLMCRLQLKLGPLAKAACAVNC